MNNIEYVILGVLGISILWGIISIARYVNEYEAQEKQRLKNQRECMKLILEDQSLQNKRKQWLLFIDVFCKNHNITNEQQMECAREALEEFYAKIDDDKRACWEEILAKKLIDKLDK